MSSIEPTDYETTTTLNPHVSNLDWSLVLRGIERGRGTRHYYNYIIYTYLTPVSANIGTNYAKSLIINILK